VTFSRKPLTTFSAEGLKRAVFDNASASVSSDLKALYKSVIIIYYYYYHDSSISKSLSFTIVVLILRFVTTHGRVKDVSENTRRLAYSVSRFYVSPKK